MRRIRPKVEFVSLNSLRLDRKISSLGSHFLSATGVGISGFCGYQGVTEVIMSRGC